MKQVGRKVWLTTGSLVVGWDVDELNLKIDEFNLFPWALEADFFQWLSWDMNDGCDYQGFSGYANRKNSAMSYVHTIRKKV